MYTLFPHNLKKHDYIICVYSLIYISWSNAILFVYRKMYRICVSLVDSRIALNHRHSLPALFHVDTCVKSALPFFMDCKYYINAYICIQILI